MNEKPLKRPSKKQRELLTFIDNFIKGNGFGPSYREIMRMLDYKSVSTVAVHIDNLIEKGLLKKHTRSARSLEVVNSADSTKPAAPASNDKHSKWLIEKINAQFDAAEEKPTLRKVDNLYVLVGALHVLGLEQAHKEAKARLLELRKKVV